MSHRRGRGSYISWMIFECQPSVIRGAKKSPAQMLFTLVVSDAPVPAVCQVLRPFQPELNKANGSKSVPKQVCDSSTCVSPGIRSPFPCPDKESDLWQNKKDLSAPGRLELSKESDSHNIHLLSPDDADRVVVVGVEGPVGEECSGALGF